MHRNRSMARLWILILLGMMAGCAVSTRDARDPMENWNRGAQLFNDSLDEYVGKPIATGYQWIMPSFADRGVTNFFSNINDISVTINDLLQLKLSQAGMDGSRFIVNTVAGIGGFIDVATMIDLPKHEEDFDQTLGVWGVPIGPYLVLPFIGPSSPRGLGGLIVDTAMNPISYLDSGIISGSLFAVNWTDFRADNLGTERTADEAALDRYEFFKNAYLQRRNYLVNDGDVPDEDLYLEINEEPGAR
jgi:phospholipid-binding lipoprotein MlaA